MLGNEVMAKNCAGGRGNLLKDCYEWQETKLKFECWANNLKQEIDKTGLRYNCKRQLQNGMCRTRSSVTDRSNGISKQTAHWAECAQVASEEKFEPFMANKRKSLIGVLLRNETWVL